MRYWCMFGSVEVPRNRFSQRFPKDVPLAGLLKRGPEIIFCGRAYAICSFSGPRKGFRVVLKADPKVFLEEGLRLLALSGRHTV